MAKKKPAKAKANVKRETPRPVLTYRVMYRDLTERLVECVEMAEYGGAVEFSRRLPPDTYVTTLVIPLDLVKEVALVEELVAEPAAAP